MTVLVTISSYAISWNKSLHAHEYKNSSIKAPEMLPFSVGAKRMWNGLLNLSLHTRAHALLSGRWIISWCFLAGGGVHRGERPAKLFCHFSVMSYGTPPPALLYDTATGSFSPRLSSCIHGHHSAGPPLLFWGETPNSHPEPLALTIWLYWQTPTKAERERGEQWKRSKGPATHEIASFLTSQIRTREFRFRKQNSCVV